MKYMIPSIVGVMYGAQGIYHLIKGEHGYALMWMAYALANAGICLAMAEGTEGH